MSNALDTVPERVAALGRFIELAGPYVSPHPGLAAADRVVTRAGQRLALSRAHTVVVLAGATGSGKSSIFNAFAGSDLSTVGVRRPTTGDAHACVWGPDGAQELLDWLGVRNRHSRTDEPGLTGLVLLDLPDFDSVEAQHRIEADRLLGLADLIVWVLDPQKYADKVLHRQYLAAFGQHRDITVVALNQADRLSRPDLALCLTDLTQLLAADGLAGVPIMATSIVDQSGLDDLRAVLEKAVAARIAALQRLSADVATVAAELTPLVEAPLAVRSATIDRGIADDLYAALGAAAGVPMVVRAVEKSYVHRARRHVGWPVTRWVRRFRADPLSRLRLGTMVGRDRTGHGEATQSTPPAATSIGPAAPAARAAVGLALRSVGDRHGTGLAEQWHDAMLAAARSRTDDLPDALDLAVVRTDLGMNRTPAWWRAIGLVQWLFVLAAVVGLGWLVLRYVLFALALPEPPTPDVGRIPLFTVLFVGGLLAGLLSALVMRPIVAIAARRRGRLAAARLTAAVRRVGDEFVLAPVREVGQRYEQARSALRTSVER